MKDSFDFIFDRGDLTGKCFSFSGDISDISNLLGEGELFDGIFMIEEEFSDSEGVFFVSFGFAEGEFSKI